MKISLALVLASISVLTVAQPGFVHERREDHHHHHPHHHHHHHHHPHHHPNPKCASQNHTTHPGSTTHPAAIGPGTASNSGTPKPVAVTTPTGNPNATPSQGTTTGLTTSPAATPATRPAVTSKGGWEQNPKGNASFTGYSNCQSASCGQRVNGYSAAVNELAFGANRAAGDACGRCFLIKADHDPYSPSYKGTFGNTIIVKANDLCPGGPNNEWCGQTVSKPLNQHQMSMHFDLCIDSGASDAFFPSDRHALTGTYEEVSCSQWKGTDGDKLWNGSCLAGENAQFWPATACGNDAKSAAPA